MSTIIIGEIKTKLLQIFSVNGLQRNLVANALMKGTFIVEEDRIPKN